MRFPYSKHFAKFITRVQSYGIVYNWVRRLRNEIRTNSETEPIMADIRFQHVHLIMFGFIILSVVSFIILILEIVIFKKDQKRIDMVFRRSNVTFN